MYGTRSRTTSLSPSQALYVDAPMPSPYVTRSGTDRNRIQAIYIFCVLPNTPVQIPNYVVITAANMSFILDDLGVVNTFHRDPLPTQDYMYNYSVFSHTGLINQQHSLTVQLLSQSYMAFDYATYTFVKNKFVVSCYTNSDFITGSTTGSHLHPRQSRLLLPQA